MAVGLPDVSPAGISRIPDVSRGAGAAEEVVAGMYATLGEKAADLRRTLTPAGSEVARQRAYKDVTSGRFRGPRLVFSAEDAAYNESAESTWLARAHADVRAAIGDAATTNPYDVEAFLEAADAARSAYKQRSPLAFGQSLDALFGQETTYQVDNITRAARARETELEAKDKQSNVDALWNRVTAYADAGDLSSSAFAAARDQWGAAFLAWAASPLSGLSEETARRAYDQHIDQLTLLSARPQALEIYATEGPQAALEYAEEVAADPDLDASPEMRGALRSEIATAVRQAETERRLKESELRSTLSRMESNFGLSFDPLTKAVEQGARVSILDLARARETAIELDAVREMAGEAPVHVAAVDRLAALGGYRDSIAKLPPALLEQRLIALRTEPPAPGMATTVADVIRETEAALKANGPAWRENPLGTARSLGAPVPEINFDQSAGDLGVALAVRASIADELEAYARQEVPLFEPTERRSLARALADPARGVQVAQALAAAAPERFEEELAEVSELDEESAVIAWSARLGLADAGDAAQTIARGIALRADPEHQTAIPTGASEEERLARIFGEEAGAALAGTVYEGRLRSAAEAVYEVRAQEKRIPPGRLDETLWRASIREAAGGAGEWGGIVEMSGAGSRPRGGQAGGFVERTGRVIGGAVGSVGRARARSEVIAPPWLRSDRLADVVYGLSESDLVDAGGALPVDADGYPLSASELAGYQMRNVDGRVDRYYFLAPDGGPVMRYAADGRFVPYVLELSRLRAGVGARRPDWVR